ncbi:MAG TPA: transposase, partial [Streptomyces sp.]|nr:transposase [Streptomyces sp.]
MCLAVSAADVRHLACHRASPLAAWTRAGLWRRLHRAVLEELGARGALDWTSAIIDAASVRVKRGGSLTGPNPVDRGKKGSKLHVLSEAQGIPLAVAVSGANVHDSQAFKPLLLGLPAIRSRRGPRRRRPVKVRADKAYHSAEHFAWLRSRGVIPRIARPGIESGKRLGPHR